MMDFIYAMLLLHFNSIKVRLEQVYQGSGWMLLHPFQFHKGAIRTYFATRLEVIRRLFQFHKGAIRT